MGLGKSLKKIVKKVTKIADPAGLTGKGEGESKPAAAVAAPTTPAPAAVVEAPKDSSETTDNADTEAGKKAARARGKRGLSVARSSGTGINI